MFPVLMGEKFVSGEKHLAISILQRATLKK